MTDTSHSRWLLRPWVTGTVAVFVVLATSAATLGNYAWRRSSVIAWIASTGGMVSFEDVPAWVPEQVAGDYPNLALPIQMVLVGEFPDPPERIGVLHEARVLDLSHFPARDEHLRPLRNFRRLESLYVQATGVTDAGLVPLHDCRYLTELNLSGTQVTDAGLAHLVGLPLESLDLSETKVTNAGMATLRSLSRLSTLRLAATAVDEDGLNELRGLPLTTLDLSRTPIADRGLDALRSMPDLEEVNLSQTAVGDAESAVLSDLARLHTLDLAGTLITDAGMDSLAKLPLESLNLSRTHVTSRGLASLSGQTTLTFADLSGTAVEYEAADKFCGSRDMVANASGGGLRLYDRKAYRCARSCPPP